MGASYQIEVATAVGTRLAVLDLWTSLDYTRTVNGTGTLNLTLPIGAYPLGYFSEDNRLYVYRTPTGGTQYLDGEACWFIRKLDKVLTGKGEKFYELTAFDANYLLSSRIVNYAPGSACADMTDQLDDMAKAVVRSNLGASSTDATRSLGGYLAFQPDLAAGPAASRSMSMRNVADAIKEMADASASTTYMAYDTVVADPTSGALEFRTYTGQRGVDHRFPGGINPVVLDPNLGNLADIRLSYDWTQEVTVAYVRGSGASAAGASAIDSTRANVSPFNRREVVVSAYGTSGSALWASQAAAAVRAGRPRKTFTATVLETPGTIYGVHWGFGDYLTVNFDNEAIDCRVEKVNINIKNSNETIRVSLRSES